MVIIICKIISVFGLYPSQCAAVTEIHGGQMLMLAVNMRCAFKDVRPNAGCFSFNAQF